VAVAVLSCVIVAGCAETQAYETYREDVASWSIPKHIGVTFKDWFFDATDIVSVEVGIGETIGFNIQPTEPLQIGFLYGDVFKFGYRDRGLGFYRDIRRELGITGMHYYRDMTIEPVTGTQGLMERPRIFKHYPLRSNEDWHYGDIGAEVGLVMVQAGAHMSPKEALDFAITTLALPWNLLVRPVLCRAGAHFPEIDICEDDTFARLREQYGITLVKHPEGFWPAEFINDLFRTPY